MRYPKFKDTNKKADQGRDYIIQTLPKARHKMAGDVKINVFPAIRTRLGTFQDGGAKSFNDGCLEDSSL